MGRLTLYILILCCCCCCWSSSAERTKHHHHHHRRRRGPCVSGCQCIQLNAATSSNSGSRIKAADWYRLMVAYRLQQKYVQADSILEGSMVQFSTHFVTCSQSAAHPAPNQSLLSLIRAADARWQTSFAKSNTVGLLRRRDLLAPKAQ